MGTQEDDLRQEVAALRREIERLNESRFIRIRNSMPKFIGFQFIKGLAVGFGTVVGASVLVSIVVYALSRIDFVPIIGKWAAEVSQEIKLHEGEGRDRSE